jgi:peroxiredoxin
MAEVRLAPGDAAPDFSLPDADGDEVSLSSLRGQRVIIYFYPAAMTPGWSSASRRTARRSWRSSASGMA